MYGSPLLSTLPSSKKTCSSADQQPADLLSVDELLDNPWHYDCVVSPRLLLSDFASPPAKSLKSHHPTNSASNRPAPSATHHNPAALSSSSYSALSVNHPRSSLPSLSKPSGDRLHSPPPPASNRPPCLSQPANPPPASAPQPAKSEKSLPSNYVSLASFIQNPDKSSYGSSEPAAALDLLSKRSFGKPLKPVLSKCRERDSKPNIRGDSSRIRSHSGCLAVD